jgi:plastocyanin
VALLLVGTALVSRSPLQGVAAGASVAIDSSGSNGCVPSTGGQGSSFCFTPNSAMVSAGSTVTWSNRAGVNHTVTRCSVPACGVDGGTGGDPASFDTGTIINGGQASVVFQGAGTYVYYCAIHGYGAMHGSVTVSGTPTPSPTPPPPSPAATYAAAQGRLLDTRSGFGEGGTAAPIGSGAGIDVVAAGATLQNGTAIPPNATALVLNLTVVDDTEPSFITGYPAGAARPDASSLNMDGGGQIRNNLATLTAGMGGKISFFNAHGSTDLVADVEGYYAPPQTTASGTSGLYNPLVPARVADTRPGSGQPAAGQTLTPSQPSIDVQVAGVGGVPGSGVSAVVLQVTATGATAPSFLTIYRQGAMRPLVSSLNFDPLHDAGNRVLAPVSSTGRISIFNANGSVNVVADVSGWFTDGTGSTGFRYVGIAPGRILDTRPGSGSPGAGHTLGQGGTLMVTAAGVGQIPGPGSATPPKAIVANITVVEGSTVSFLTVYPSDAMRPLASDLNFGPAQILGNMAVPKLAADGIFTIYNDQGTTDVVVDAVGYYI